MSKVAQDEEEFERHERTNSTEYIVCYVEVPKKEEEFKSDTRNNSTEYIECYVQVAK
jgi:hypothetical protein